MLVKTRQVFYGTDCLPYKDKERKVHYPIIEPAFQGASQTNEIKFYIDEIGGTDLCWIAVGMLPNGKVVSKVLETSSDEDGNYALLEMSGAFTQAVGNVLISLKGYAGGAEITYDDESEIYTIDGNPVIQTTGSVQIYIRYATPYDQEYWENVTIQEMLALIFEKLGKGDTHYLKVIDKISNLNSADYKEYYSKDCVVYSIQEKTFYTISGTYPSLVATAIRLDKVVTTDTTQNISGSKIFSGQVEFDNNVIFTNPVEITSSAKLTLSGGASIEKTLKANFVKVGTSSPYITYNLPYDPTDITPGVYTLATTNYVQEQIGTALASVYKIQGSAEPTYLNNLTKTESLNGNVYNISTAGTLTDSDDRTTDVVVGDNVVFVWNEGQWYWDVLSGLIDASVFYDKSHSIVPTTTGLDIGSSTNTFNDIYLSGDIKSGNNYITIDSVASQYSGPNQIQFYVDGTKVLSMQKGSGGSVTAVWAEVDFLPRGNERDLGNTYNRWRDLYIYRNFTDGTNSFTVAEGMAQFNPNEAGTSEIKWTKMLTLTITLNSTLTFEATKTGCLCEYKAIIVNGNRTAGITITLPSGVIIGTNDDNITITNNTFTLPVGVTVELNCVNNWCIVYNHSAE